MSSIGFELLTPDDVHEDWSDWFRLEHARYYTRSGREITVQELRRSIAEGLERNDQFTFGIRHVADDVLIGTVKLGPIDAEHGLSDMSVFIGDVKYLGRGLGVEVVKGASQLAFEHYGVQKLHGGVLERNAPSIKAYTKAGWMIEGVLHKHYVNEGVRQDWFLISCFNPAVFAEPVPAGLDIDILKK